MEETRLKLARHYMNLTPKQKAKHQSMRKHYEEFKDVISSEVSPSKKKK